MRAWAYKEIHRHVVIYNTVIAPYCTHGGGGSNKQFFWTSIWLTNTTLKLLFWCLTQSSPTLQLKLALIRSLLFFSIFFSYLSSLSHAHSPTFSFQSLPTLTHLSFRLLFMLPDFHRWSDLRQWWLFKTQFKWMQGCHNKNCIKGMHTNTYLTLLWHESLVVVVCYFKSRMNIFHA